MNLPEHLRSLFLEEFDDLSRALQSGLLDLEGSSAPAGAVTELFRSAHSLKGAAQVAGARPLVLVANGLETLLGGLRNGTLQPTRDLVDGMLTAVDWLTDAAEHMRRGDEADTRSARAVAAQLAGLAPGGGEALSPDEPAAVSAVPEPAREVTPPLDGPGALRERDAVRVAATKLDQVLADAGEVMAARESVEVLRRDLVAAVQTVRGTDEHSTQLRDVLRPLAARAAAAERELRLAAGPLAHNVLQLRMIPFRQICEGLERVARDSAHANDKRVTLAVDDGSVELDRSIATALREPLIHLVHNAVDHGIEAPAQRQMAGKPETGTVRIAAQLRGGRVAIEVSDDGRGLRTQEVREAADRIGLAAGMDSDDVTAAVFEPGLSTAAAVTETSGRGVGLDAVRARVEGLGGSVDLAFEQGAGTTVTMVVPLTLSIVHAVTVRVAEQILALPSAGVQRVARLAPEALLSIGGHPTMGHDGMHVPVMDLAQVLGLPSQPPPSGALPVVLVKSAGSTVALVVQALLGEQELTVHDLGERLHDAPAVLGGALLDGANIALVVSAPACARLGLNAATSPALQPAAPAEDAAARPRILLAEDTMTTRALEKGILEAAGYEVRTAVDGADAWEQLRAHGADVVISDVNMPNMDGFTLCATIRQSRRFADLPVVLVTSLADDADRRRGLEAGASAYITKAGFDQGLLVDTVERLLG